jgi:hypothetical protein
MINLLPPDLKQAYGYARRNNNLLHLLASCGLAIIGLALIAGAGVLYLHQTAKTYTAQAVSAEEELRKQNPSDVEKQVTDISGNLKLAVQVLSQEVLFSKLLARLAVITPGEVSLTGLRIDKFGGGLDINAVATTYKAATQLQVNMSDPNNKVFAKVDIVSIGCQADPNSRKGKYACQAQYRAQFAANNPFLFINLKPGG